MREDGQKIGKLQLLFCFGETFGVPDFCISHIAIYIHGTKAGMQAIILIQRGILR